MRGPLASAVEVYFVPILPFSTQRYTASGPSVQSWMLLIFCVLTGPRRTGSNVTQLCLKPAESRYAGVTRILFNSETSGVPDSDTPTSVGAVWVCALVQKPNYWFWEATAGQRMRPRPFAARVYCAQGRRLTSRSIAVRADGHFRGMNGHCWQAHGRIRSRARPVRDLLAIEASPMKCHSLPHVQHYCTGWREVLPCNTLTAALILLLTCTAPSVGLLLHPLWSRSYDEPIMLQNHQI